MFYIFHHVIIVTVIPNTKAVNFRRIINNHIIVSQYGSFTDKFGNRLLNVVIKMSMFPRNFILYAFMTINYIPETLHY